VVAIDGKTVRRSHRDGNRPIHLVSAYSTHLNLVLGQTRTQDHSNEITAIPELLDALLLKGAIVTIDAMGCQRNIAQKIIDGGADYVLAVKGNQEGLFTKIREVFAIQERHDAVFEDAFAQYCDVDKDHGRIETRRCVVHDIAGRKPDDAIAIWPGARTVVMIEATREIGQTLSAERRYYVSSLPADAQRIALAVRAHWRIENAMHWVLDMAFDEDQCRARVDHAAQNFAILRRIALNLLRQDTVSKVGIKNRRLKACANDTYRAQLLAW
jgi:predicted transposase YbfD/YdcC